MSRRTAHRVMAGAGGVLALALSLGLWSEYGVEVLLSQAFLSCF